MDYIEIFEQLWKDYTDQNPSVQKIYNLFLDKEGKVVNDHIAFRTFNDNRINVDVLSKIFIKAGYIEKGQYVFDAKKLKAKHYEHATDSNAPLVFISELNLEDFSESLQEKVHCIINNIDPQRLKSERLIFDKTIFGIPSYDVYQEFLKESEYAAWLYINGFRANHFTVRINENKYLDSIEKVNSFLKENGFKINDSGGEIKGTPDQLLEQSSIMAEKIKVKFMAADYEVPGCYYEFAKRYPDEKGNLFTGFIAKSADKIFESTDSK